MNAISTWAGQVTTGHGAMTLVGTLLACLSGQMTWAAATPLLAVAVVGLLWPENAQAAGVVQKVATDAQPLAADVEAAVRSYLARMIPTKQAPVPAAAPTATAGTVSIWGALILGVVATAVLAWVWCAPGLPSQVSLLFVVVVGFGVAMFARRCRFVALFAGLGLALAGCGSTPINPTLLSDGQLAGAALQVLITDAQTLGAPAEDVSKAQAVLAALQTAVADLKKGSATAQDFATLATDEINSVTPTLLADLHANATLTWGVTLLENFIPLIAADVAPVTTAPTAAAIDRRSALQAWVTGQKK